jgi:hypothetical protein
METIKQSPWEKRLKGPVALAILIGVILKMTASAYGPIIFTIGFLGYFLLKFIRLSKTNRYLWTALHTIQIILLVLAAVALIFLYYQYPYSRIAFIVLLLAESLVNLKIMINTYIGNENFKNILSFLGRLIKR